MKVGLASSWLLALLGSPWLGAVLVCLGRWGRQVMGRLAFGSVALSSCALAAAWGGRAEASVAWQPEALWIPPIGARFALLLDDLSFPFVLNVLLVALAATAYGWGYYQHTERLHLCLALTLAFVGSMLGTLLADDLIVFLVFWEGMLLASTLLLAGWGEGPAVLNVALRYFFFMQAGSLALLGAFAWLAGHTGSVSPQQIADRLGMVPPGLAGLASVMLLGFGIKLAVAPLHSWLPDAHAIAPMPVTVLLAAAMLSMGAYGILRFPLALLEKGDFVLLQPLLLTLGLFSQVYGGLMCLASKDVKRIVAYSSVSQMGYVLFALATLTLQGVAGSVFHIVAHGILKALLFMSVGLVMRATGRRDINQLGGLARTMPRAAALLFLATLTLAAVPPLCAFHSEWLILSGGLASGYPLLAYLEFLAPLLTAGYGLWLSTRLALGEPPPGLETKPVPRSMLWSCYGLATLSLVVGLVPAPFYSWAMAAARLVLGGGSP
ncbi:MAG: NADH-quinone oxidoreductase subunit M [Chloroflexi bacterium]|nr:NADH-quinone oxidoreductase subunit M [Chloroflexota bacterium]